MNFFRKKSSLLIVISAFSLTSCSWMSNRKVLFEANDAPSKPSPSKSQMVTKTQYDQLLQKYEGLLQKIKHAEKTSASNVDKAMVNQSMPTKIPIRTQDQLVSELSKITPAADLAETVDVFGKNGLTKKLGTPKRSRPQKRVYLNDNQIQSQLNTLQKANDLVKQNKMDSALVLLKDLEESPNKQIRVRAKFYLAEMLFRQAEYDLAMQMYEEIVTKHAFSGLVIKSLGRLIVCSEKLKLGKKKERYYSVLHDFFEQA